MNIPSKESPKWDGFDRRELPVVRKTSAKIIFTAVVLAIFIFILDLQASLDVAGGVPYVVLVLFGWRFQERSAVLFLAAASTLLTVLGYYYSLQGGVEVGGLANRILAIIVIWVTAAMLWWAWRERTTVAPLSITNELQRQNSIPLTGREAVFVLLLSIVIFSASWIVLNRIEAGAKSDVGKFLKSALETSDISIRKQLEIQRKSAEVWAKNPLVRNAINELAALSKVSDTQDKSAAQEKLRLLIVSLLELAGYKGYFVIGNDNINLASSDNKRIGVVSLLAQQGDFLERVRAGETLVSLPQKSDVPLEDFSGEVISNLATMFIATPVYNGGGFVSEILAFRLDPDESFTPIFERSRFGNSGDAYAFSKTGLLISESRFNESLKKIGLIHDVKHSDLHVEIRDPGVNMMMGQKPSLPRDKQPLTRMAKSATNGQSGINLDGYRDYRGVPVVGAWLWDAELGFGVASEIDIEEAFATFNNVRFVIYLFSGLSIGVLIVLALVSSRTRKQIVQSEKKYRNIIDSTSEGYGKIDDQGRLLEVNKAFCEMLGRSPEEILGKRPFEFSTADNRADFEHHVSKFKTYDQRQYEAVFESKQGKAVHVQVSATSISDAHGKTTGAFAFFTDITKSKEAERELFAKVKELDFQKYALDEHAIVSITDAKGNITYVNDKFCAISGYSRQELLGQNHRVLKSDGHLAEFYEDIWRTITNGKVWNGSIKNCNKDGRDYWVNSTIVPFLDDRGKPFQYVAIRTDITAQKESDAAMYESERRFRTMVENAGDAIYIHDRYGKIFDINKIACDQVGYSRDELLELSVAQLDAAIDFENLRETWDLGEADPSKYPMTLETAHRRKDGTTFPIEVRISLLPSEEGARFVAMVRDITARKQVEEALRESEELLSAAINNISDGFILVDADNRIVLFNNRFKALYPNSRDLIQEGASFNDFVRGGAERGEYADAMGRVEDWLTERKARGHESSESFDQQLIGNRWVRISVGRLPDGGWVGMHVDVTLIKEAMESADKANLAKSEFLSSMSHELRTPMNAILGFAQMLNFNPKEPLSKTQKESVDHIMKGGQHLLELINDILDFAKIEAGKVELSLEIISPREILDECLLLISNMAAANGITISSPDAATNVPLVLADHTRFKQVLLNFMSNAVKYNRENGTMFIHFEEVPGDMLRISVTDTGEGIPDEKQQELFKPFSRLGAENSEIEGTGIGLVVCKDLIDLMNGAVGFESVVGKGSYFWFDLPLAEGGHSIIEATKEALAAQDDETTPEALGTLLYVEDNPDNLKLMELIITRMEGLKMISTHTGELGIELARAEKPDLIILDINLPGISGLETIKRLQSHESTRNIPVLALSAAATPRDIEKGMEAGFLRYLTKPIMVPKVMEAIRSAMETTSSDKP